MASEPDEIREVIEHTREELGETVQALARKADVKARAKEKMNESKLKAQASARQATEKVMEVTKPVAEPAAKVASKKKLSIPIGVLAGAGGIFLAVRMKNRSEGRAEAGTRAQAAS